MVALPIQRGRQGALRIRSLLSGYAPGERTGPVRPEQDAVPCRAEGPHPHVTGRRASHMRVLRRCVQVVNKRFSHGYFGRGHIMV